MSYKLNLSNDPFNNGFNIFQKKSVELSTGVTILVGCNGFGKSTFIALLIEQLKKENIPYYSYDNLHEGSSRSISRVLEEDDASFGALMLQSSEGENIIQTIGRFMGNMYNFIVTGENPDPKKRFSPNMIDEEEVEDDDKEDCCKRFIIMDAVDSGLSIDNTIDFKAAFNFMISDAKQMGIELYIIVATNSYEFANGEKCLDVYTGDYTKFADYDDYKSFILKTSDIKNERYDNYNKKIAKRDSRRKRQIGQEIK